MSVTALHIRSQSLAKLFESHQLVYTFQSAGKNDKEIFKHPFLLSEEEERIPCHAVGWLA